MADRQEIDRPQVGESSNDILIGGTSTHSGNMSVLDAIMAEWTSENSYAKRVSNLLNGGGANTDWLFQSANDVLDAFLGETVTTL